MGHSILLASVLMLSSVVSVEAAELKIIAGGGIAAALNEIAAQFESNTGHPTIIRYGTTPELIKMATGTSFDLAVVPQDVFQDAAARAQFVPDQIPAVARVGLGLAVRAGAARPDIGTAEALKQTLLTAQAIASIPASATGTQLAALYQRLGIADEMQAKTKAAAGPAQIIEAVAKGDCDLAVFLINVLSDPRLDVVGPFPAEVQREVVYATSVAANSKQSQVAKAFIAYLRSAPAAAVFKAKAMTPG